MRFLRLIIFFFFTHASLLFGSNGIYLDVNLSLHGMFSVFCFVAGVLYEYDNNDYSGIKVDFRNSGLYYDAEHGPNWWEYFCKPICIGNEQGCVKQFTGQEYINYAIFAETELTRQQVFHLINKYILIQDHIQQKIDKFVSENFSGWHIIGVHYRGTDKISELPLVSFYDVYRCIANYIHKNKLKKYKIFVASDETQFVDFMYRKFGDIVISYSTQRSNDIRALHYKLMNIYLHGEEAFIDCQLLSKGDVLIRTSSNLSLWSTFFNPIIPVIALSERKL